MVKSVVKAMDALQKFARDEWQHDLKQFVVTGASKRGWTTWLTGASDPRVKAIIPMVIDALNSEQITRHQYEAYGFFGPSLGDYVRHGLFPHRVGTAEYQEVLKAAESATLKEKSSLRSHASFTYETAPAGVGREV